MLQIMQIRLASTPHIVSAALSLPNNKLQLSLYAGSPKDGAPLIDMADDGSGMPQLATQL